jgi:FAD/FMN-containing dehydrogenase
VRRWRRLPTSEAGRGADPRLLTALAEVVGEPNVLTEQGLVAPFVTDWTGRYAGHTAAVVRPATTEEVAGVVAVCRARGASLVPQGGNTGLVGGSVPFAGEVVLSLGGLAGVDRVDRPSKLLVARAGTTLSAVQEAAAGAGLAYGVDLGARGSATIGGTVATNAGGIRFLRHGGTRQQLAGIEAVLGSGSTISHLAGLPKDNTGYDLGGLLCGSEGTLGVITRACLRLVEAYAERAVALLGFDSAPAALEAASALGAAGLPLDALEMIWGDSLRLVCSAFELASPFEAADYLLVECAQDADPLPALAAAVESLAGVTGGAVATDPRRRAELWRFREEIPLAVATVGTPVKLDVAVPLPAQGELAASVAEALGRAVPGCRLYLFGHVADGNVHVNVVPPGERLDAGVAGRIEETVYRLVADLGGSISAEHGIGRAKLPWLPLVRSGAELAAFRAIKSALDPDGILNPGCLVPG